MDEGHEVRVIDIHAADEARKAEGVEYVQGDIRVRQR